MTAALTAPAASAATADLIQDTFKTPDQAPPPAPPGEACLVYIYPTGPLMGSRYPLGPDPVLIGRNDDCPVRNVDASVSRHHARIVLGADGRYHVADLGSTNGTFVNNVPKTASPLADGDYLRIGNCIYRFLAGGNIEAEYHEEIYRLTVMDGLTDVPNRRLFQDFLDREVVRAVRHRRPLAVALLDIDHFKAINDRLGHVAGDMTLRQLAGCIRGIVRKDELFARYGGEEFAVVLPELDLGKAVRVGERIRKAVADHRFTYNKERYPVTVSVGVGVLAAGEEIAPSELVRRADEMLYEAKRTGRDRVCPAG